MEQGAAWLRCSYWPGPYAKGPGVRRCGVRLALWQALLSAYLCLGCVRAHLGRERFRESAREAPGWRLRGEAETVGPRTLETALRAISSSSPDLTGIGGVRPLRSWLTWPGTRPPARVRDTNEEATSFYGQLGAALALSTWHRCFRPLQMAIVPSVSAAVTLMRRQRQSRINRALTYLGPGPPCRAGALCLAIYPALLYDEPYVGPIFVGGAVNHVPRDPAGYRGS
jgi:hypothetical protein